MVALTGGELRGTVLTPDQRSLSMINKVGFDRQLNKDLRVRLTGSLYKTDKAMSDTLYGGDRAGSPYFWVLENTQASETTNAFSGTINPGFRNKVTAVQVNPFVKFRGLEVFGVLERADGRTAAEVQNRTFNQYAVDTVYRFFEAEKLFVGARYNRVNGNLAGIVNDVGANRWEIGAGWFVIPGLLDERRVRRSEILRLPGWTTSRTAAASRARCSKASSPSSALETEVHRVCHEPESNGRHRRASCPPVRHAWNVVSPHCSWARPA